MPGRVRRRITPKEQEYLRHLLAQAREMLAAAEHLSARDHPRGAVSLLSNACEVAAGALLSLRGGTSHRDAALATAFSEYWSGPGRLSVEMADALHAILESGAQANHDPGVTFSRTQVEAWLSEARAFLVGIQTYIDRELTPEENAAPKEGAPGRRASARRLETMAGIGDGEKALLREARHIVQGFVPDAELWLYGSSARGERTPESDWDVLVLTDRKLAPEEEDAIRRAVYRAELAHGPTVLLSFLFCSREEWESGLISVSSYHRDVERDRVIL